MTKKNLLTAFNKNYTGSKHEELSIQEYLDLCKKDPSVYASAAERMLKAIGEPQIIDTSKDKRLNRIFCGRTIKSYPAFKDFYGIDEAVESIVGFFKHAAQGLEEKRQILYLLGPVGSSKSSLAERLKSLMKKEPIYVLKAGDEISPIFENALGLFDIDEFSGALESDYGIHKRYLNGICSPWATKRLEEFIEDGKGINGFSVVKLVPSELHQIGIIKTEPGDDNNQDISSLVGKVDLRKLEDFSQNDPDAYTFSGALCRGNQGIVEFVEMFKAPIKMLHPLLTATQEGNYKGTEAIPAIPFQGVILAHSNESEWQTFKNNKNNEAFIDRVCVVKVPYCLRVDEEVEIYSKYLNSTDLHKAACAPKTLENLAKFTVLSRLKEHDNSSLPIKMSVYNGENLKDTSPNAKSITEYRSYAGVDEGMSGISTRFAFKTLNKTFNFDSVNVEADPVHLFAVLEDSIIKEQFPEETQEKLLGIIKDHLVKDYSEWLGKEIQRAYIESYDDYGQNVFDNYISLADAWIQNNDFKNPDTGLIMDKEEINIRLEKLEKVALISAAKDFRNEVVNFCLRFRANNEGKNPNWKAYEKMREVIEKRMFTNMEEILPVISFDSKKSKKEEKEHSEFVKRMNEMGYTATQIRRLTEFYIGIVNSR